LISSIQDSPNPPQKTSPRHTHLYGSTARYISTKRSVLLRQLLPGKVSGKRRGERRGLRRGQWTVCAQQLHKPQTFGTCGQVRKKGHHGRYFSNLLHHVEQRPVRVVLVHLVDVGCFEDALSLRNIDKGELRVRFFHRKMVGTLVYQMSEKYIRLLPWFTARILPRTHHLAGSSRRNKPTRHGNCLSLRSTGS
jgi:hypothetical protein